MDQGNWIPMSKYLSRYLPDDRVYTKLEATFCIQKDYDSKKAITVLGYASLWRWSRKMVKKFFEDLGVEVIYQKNTTKIQNQKGQIGLQIRDRSGTDKGQIRLIDNKQLQNNKNTNGTDQGQIRDRWGSTTVNTKTNTKKKDKDIPTPGGAEPSQQDYYITRKKRKLNGKRLESFNRFWKAFGFFKGKAEAADSWYDILNLTDELANKIVTAAETYAKNRPDLIEAGNTPKWAQGWISCKRWEDEVDSGCDDKGEWWKDSEVWQRQQREKGAVDA